MAQRASSAMAATTGSTGLGASFRSTRSLLSASTGFKGGRSFGGTANQSTGVPGGPGAGGEDDAVGELPVFLTELGSPRPEDRVTARRQMEYFENVSRTFRGQTMTVREALEEKSIKKFNQVYAENCKEQVSCFSLPAVASQRARSPLGTAWCGMAWAGCDGQDGEEGGRDGGAEA